MNKKTIITFTQNGPYLVHNLDSLENSKGDSFATGPVITLCRCGASKAKPYCDGAHREINFQGRKKPTGFQVKSIHTWVKTLLFTLI